MYIDMDVGKYVHFTTYCIDLHFVDATQVVNGTLGKAFLMEVPLNILLMQCKWSTDLNWCARASTKFCSPSVPTANTWARVGLPLPPQILSV